MIPTITNECSFFLKHSHGTPLLSNLSHKLQGFSRVKVRKQKIKTSLDIIYNMAFDDTYKYNNLTQRSVLTYTELALPKSPENTEPFYIFPIDGFKVIFSEVVTDSRNVHTETLELLENDIGVEKGSYIMSDLIKYTYRTQDLSKALSYNCEIIVYGIAYYYAVRKSLIDDYHSFIYD